MSNINLKYLMRDDSLFSNLWIISSNYPYLYLLPFHIDLGNVLIYRIFEYKYLHWKITGIILEKTLNEPVSNSKTKNIGMNLDGICLLNLEMNLFQVKIFSLSFTNKYISDKIFFLKISHSKIEYNGLNSLLRIPNLEKLYLYNIQFLGSEDNKIVEKNKSITTFEFERIRMSFFDLVLKFIKSMESLCNLSIRYFLENSIFASHDIKFLEKSEISFYRFINNDEANIGIFLLSVFLVKDSIEFRSNCELGKLKDKFSYDGYRNLKSLKIGSFKINETALNVFENLRSLESIELHPNQHIHINFSELFSSCVIYNLKFIILREMRILNDDMLFLSKSKNLERLIFDKCDFSGLSYLTLVKNNFMSLKILKFLTCHYFSSGGLHEFLNEEYSVNILT
ncbi:hypothetical protein CWI38_0323p0020 [Hamiltosporidium tvaerminnensis]|uniref:Uncharacterized protein n=1 Tax=Hamiltosporidium tvaerminnensis TaxID=1176355 RepID=A0A4Q9LYA7_9MICR|nr:hypothetical protein CWI38_0323p0020 [Hamiltosporidium tvaerminnensis]